MFWLCLHNKIHQETKKKVLWDPGKAMWTLVKEMGLKAVTIKKALNEDLPCFSYKRCKGQLLTTKAQENCLMKAKKLLNNVKHPNDPGMLWFFPDSKAQGSFFEWVVFGKRSYKKYILNFINFLNRYGLFFLGGAKFMYIIISV